MKQEPSGPDRVAESRAPFTRRASAGILELNAGRLLHFLSVGALAALIVAGIVGHLSRTLDLAMYVTWATSIVCFATAPWVHRRTDSVAWGAFVLLAGAAGPIFVPAFLLEGIRSPFLIWFAIVPMLAPIFFGVRIALISTAIGILGFTFLYVAELLLPSAETISTAPAFFSYFNLLLASIFGIATGVATRSANERSRRDFDALAEEFERKADLLEETSARQSAILDSSLSAIVGCDNHGIVTDFNPAAEKLFGYPRAYAVGRTVGDLFVPKAQRAEHESGLARYRKTEEPTILGQPVELVGRCIDGTEIPVEVQVQRIPLPGPPRFTAFLTDLRPKRRAAALLRRRDEQLQKARRLEDVGRLAGGVAHDFNNLLTIISGYCESIVSQTESDALIRKDAEEISRAAERAAVITNQLVAFSRSQELDLEALDLSRAVEGFETTLRTVCPASLEVSLQIDPPRWRVRGDARQVERICTSLVVNACDAMEDGGRLEIVLDYIEIPRERQHVPTNAKPGRYARLEFRDSGVGMSPETLSHVFEPFFTTKEVGKGTGLGLASVYGIVQQSGGYVDIESMEGAGTTVRMLLPEEVVSVKPALPKSRG